MGSQNPDPSPAQPEEAQIPSDPLLDSGTFIHVDGNDSVSIEALLDGDALGPPETPTPVAAKKLSKRDPEEMAERPSWMPQDWNVEIRMRNSGATAGTYDRYYISPTGKKFRSKTEVLHFLETGTTKKKQVNADGKPPPASSEKLKAKKPKRQKGNLSGVDFDFRNPPQNVSWTLTNASHDIWMPSGDEGLTSEAVKRTWDNAFSCITELEAKK